METPLEDVLTLWAFHHYPPLLQDDDLFDALLHFIHNLLRETVRRDRQSARLRIFRPSES